MVFVVLVIIIIIIINFLDGFSRSVLKRSLHHLYHIVTNFPEICVFIIGFSFTVWTKKSAKKVRKQVRGCLQNLYQSVAIHLKYILLVLL